MTAFAYRSFFYLFYAGTYHKLDSYYCILASSSIFGQAPGSSNPSAACKLSDIGQCNTLHRAYMRTLAIILDMYRKTFPNNLRANRAIHIINKRHKGRQMSSLYFWLILYSISAVCRGVVLS